jgi:WD40 repeat protein
VWRGSTNSGNTFATHDDWVNSVAFSPDGQYLVSGSGDGTARVWEAATRTEIARMTHDDWVNSVAFSPDGKYVVSGSNDGTARVWEVLSENEIFRITLERGSVWFVAFSPNGQHIALGGCGELEDIENLVCARGKISILDINTEKEIFQRTYDDWVNSVAFSPDSQYIVLGGDDGTARVLEIPSGTEIARVTHGDWVNSVDFGPDNQYVVSGSSDGTARVWEAATGKEIARIIHDESVKSVAFSPDGQYVVSGSDDGTARLWEAGTGKEIVRMTHDDWVRSVAFSLDGHYVVSGSADGSIRLWSWNPVDLIASTCSRLSRNLTNAEWKQYLGDEPYQATCPNLPIHPTVIAETILPTLLNANDDNRNQMAVEIASEMLKVNSTGENSNEQAIKLVNSTILDGIYVSAPDLEAGKIEPLLILLEDAKMNRLEIDDATILNSMCWFGSIYGYAEDVLQYCEQAVALFNDDEAFRDSRGLARALTGDYPGAIEDFQFFIDYGEYYDETWVQQRQEWIVALGEGKNPFTPEVLESIKNQ